MTQIVGNLDGLKPNQKKSLEKLGRKSVSGETIIQQSLAIELISLSHEISRQIGIIYDRAGKIEKVVVGDNFEIKIPEFRDAPLLPAKLSGKRFIHVHLKGELIDTSDILLLTRLRYDFIAALISDSNRDRPQSQPMIQVVYPVFSLSKGEPYEKIGPRALNDFHIDIEGLVAALEEELKHNRQTSIPIQTVRKQRAILVHVSMPEDLLDAQQSLEELEKLSISAGVEVAGKIVQRRKEIDPFTFVGKGKIIEIIVRSMIDDADMLIFDHDLSPRQARTITDMTGMKVIDRTQLILDIFAQRAKTKDGKIQVEQAQLKYLMPRLAEKDDALSRLRGGIGGRGPGETKLEIGRRRVRDRIVRLGRQIEEIARHRRVMRKWREKSGAKLIAIVGYTNAGKSTILNVLTNSNEPAENRLFSTLDPRSRQLVLPSKRKAILTDTVGLIRKLPPDLRTAFKPTFEEIEGANLVLAILDASDPQLPLHIKVIDEVLSSLHLDTVPRLNVLNKIDITEPEKLQRLISEYDAVAISALHKIGLDNLLTRIDNLLNEN